MKKLQGYRTIIVGAFLVAYAVASWAGIPIPEPDSEQALAVSGVVMMFLRFITSGPVAFKSGGGA